MTARASYLEGTATYATGSYFDVNGNAFTPQAVQYRVDDSASGTSILAWTTLTPALSNTVTVTSAQNALISPTKRSETHVVTFKITDALGNVDYQRVEYDLIRSVGLG